MILCTTRNLILRDMIQQDIEKRRIWETAETEWQLWDAPWEYEDIPEAILKNNIEEYLDLLRRRLEKLQTKTAEDIRYSFQIEERETGNYIGWINCYNIDSTYTYTDADGLLTIGIDIPERDARGRGYGYESLQSVLDYYTNRGIKEIYTQTWSGNRRMIGLAEKMGFREICRKKDYRTVRGEKYDGLTFVKKLSR